jgi:hypothetical protein
MKTTMKTTGRILIPILAVCFLALAGCKKAEPEVSGVQFHGINVDLPKLDTAFANATPDVQASLTSIPRFFRYAQFPEALMELDKLANNPSLTESQKKLVADLIEQTKQVIAKTPAPTGQ